MKIFSYKICMLGTSHIAYSYYLWKRKNYIPIKYEKIINKLLAKEIHMDNLKLIFSSVYFYFFLKAKNTLKIIKKGSCWNFLS